MGEIFECTASASTEAGLNSDAAAQARAYYKGCRHRLIQVGPIVNVSDGGSRLVKLIRAYVFEAVGGE